MKRKTEKKSFSCQQVQRSISSSHALPKIHPSVTPSTSTHGGLSILWTACRTRTIATVLWTTGGTLFTTLLWTTRGTFVTILLRTACWAFSHLLCLTSETRTTRTSTNGFAVVVGIRASFASDSQPLAPASRQVGTSEKATLVISAVRLGVTLSRVYSDSDRQRFGTRRSTEEEQTALLASLHRRSTSQQRQRE